jgi:hypothetical protein
VTAGDEYLAMLQGAREQADADMAAFTAKVRRNADGFAEQLSTMLPDGYRFAWEPVNIIANAEERANIAFAVMSDAEVEAFRISWLAAIEGAPRHKRVVLLTPLPWRTRLRLAVHHASNRAGYWLIDHGHVRAARMLWRI